MLRRRSPLSYETKQKIASAHTITGHTVAAKGTPENRTWWTWTAMKRRCFDELELAYPNYGGRGITVCERWLDYQNFIADMGLVPEGMSIDRYPDNDGNYEPGNVRWATRSQQARNRRSSHLLLIDGQEKTLAEWSELSGLASSTIRMRIKYNGGRIDNSLLAPTKKNKEYSNA